MVSVSILIPCLNEFAFIRGCLASVIGFETPDGTQIREILVIDGQSTDGTRDIVDEIALGDRRIMLLDNPGRIQSTALNIALRVASGDYVLRLDAHSSYPANYLAQALETSVRTGCENVGGLFITQTRGSGYRAALVQALTTHKFGVGDAGFRIGAQEGPADTVPYGCFRRDVFDRVGLFDERLVRAQDYEMNKRILAAGGCIWRNPAIQVKYYAQPDLISFLRKQIIYEAPYNAYMWYLAPYSFAARHAITGVFAAGVLGGLFLSPISPTVRIIFLSVMGIYFAIALASGIQQAIRYREPRHVIALPGAFFLYHFLHGIGLLGGLLRLLTRTAPVQKVHEPWPGAGRSRAWPISKNPSKRAVSAASEAVKD
jgi:glycosyltransferase involved in cell wall biosynthesis